MRGACVITPLFRGGVPFTVLSNGRMSTGGMQCANTNVRISRPIARSARPAIIWQAADASPGCVRRQWWYSVREDVSQVVCVRPIPVIDGCVEAQIFGKQPS